MDLSKHLQKAEEASRRRNYALAVGLYQQILDLDPDSGEARKGLREALDKKFEAKQGGGVLALVQGFLPLLSAAISRLTKNWAGRARNLERFLALGPFNVGANLALGESLYKAGSTQSAYVVYRHLAERLAAAGKAGPQAQHACTAWRAAGAVAHELGQLDNAMACFEGCLAINPRDQEALRARKNLSAETQLGAGGYATAESSRDLMKDKKQQEHLEKAQRIHKSTDELADELRAAEAELQGHPDDPELLGRVGMLRARKGDVGGGLEALEKAKRLAPNDARIADNLIGLQVTAAKADLDKASKLGDDAKADRLTKKIVGLELDRARARVEGHPTDLGLRHALARALLDAGDLDAAIAEFQKSVKDPRHKLEALAGLGTAFKAKGMLDLARGQLEKALEAAGPQHAKTLDLLYDLGCLCEQEDKGDEAREYFGRILAVDIGYKDVSSKLEALK